MKDIQFKMLKFAEILDEQGKHEESDTITDLAQLSKNEQQALIGSKQAEALYAFMAWLTTRSEETKFGENNDCAPAAELVNKFCQSQGWDILPERDNGGEGFRWTDDLKPYPEEDRVPYSEEEAKKHSNETPVIASSTPVSKVEKQGISKDEFDKNISDSSFVSFTSNNIIPISSINKAPAYGRQEIDDLRKVRHKF